VKLLLKGFLGEKKNNFEKQIHHKIMIQFVNISIPNIIESQQLSVLFVDEMEHFNE